MKHTKLYSDTLQSLQREALTESQKAHYWVQRDLERKEKKCHGKPPVISSLRNQPVHVNISMKQLYILSEQKEHKTTTIKKLNMATQKSKKKNLSENPTENSHQL